MKGTERDRAKRLLMSAAGAALEGDIRIEAREAAKVKTFTPGEGRSVKESFATNFTPEQKASIREMVARAVNPAEIERIEMAVRRGEFPTGVDVTHSNTGTDGKSLTRKRDSDSEKLNGFAKKVKVDL